MKKTHRLGHRRWRRKQYIKVLNLSGLKGVKAGRFLKEAMLYVADTASKLSVSTKELEQVFISLGGTWTDDPPQWGATTSKLVLEDLNKAEKEIKGKTGLEDREWWNKFLENIALGLRIPYGFMCERIEHERQPSKDN